MKVIFGIALASATSLGAPSTSTPTPNTTTLSPIPVPRCPSKNLTACLQTELDSIRSLYSDYPNLTMQVGLRRAGETIGIASGSIGGRNITIDDTFTFGSGTKTVTATAIMRLIDAGILKGHDKVNVFIDPYLWKFNGTTLANLYGDAINNATALDVIRMYAGIPDFEDDPQLDYDILQDGGFVDYPFVTMRYVANHSYCDPGACGAYSSTSYEVAGLLLASILTPDAPWYAMDLGEAALPNRSRYPSLVFPASSDDARDKLSDVMTVPGTVWSDRFGSGTTIHDQHPSILGWTCGNMVGSARDVATFFYDLLDAGSEEPIVSDSARSEMTTFTTMSHGWWRGHLRYGAGLILRSTGGFEYLSSNSMAGDWGWAIGHTGDTYGFSSSQGYLPSLGFAYSVASNVDDWTPAKRMACVLTEVAIEVLGGTTVDLDCSSIPEPIYQSLKAVFV